MSNLLAKISARKYQVALLLIILVSLFLRFYALGRADVLTDEASIAFRSIGYFDWLATPYQTTPLEWIDFRPWWIYLSFHDHPAFGFLLQYLQFKATGVSLWAMRIWPAIYGLLSVYLLYLIGKKLFGQKTALLAGSFLAVSSLHVWVSRLALQESLVILLGLVSVWIFLKSLDHKKYFYLLGLSLGLALAVKLTTIVWWPVFILYLILFKRQVFKNKEIYLSWLITGILTMPYIIYNIFLYNNFAHFDFQFSYLFKQQVEAWQLRPGRMEIPEKSMALKFIFLGLKNAISPAYLYLSIFATLAGVFVWLKNKGRNIGQNYYLLTIIILFYIILFIFIGSPARFLALLMPWMALALAIIFRRLFKINKYLAWLMVSLLLVYQAFFAFNTNIFYSKIGQSGILYSSLGYQSGAYGYNQLEDYLEDLLEGKKPAATLLVVNPNINNFIQDSFNSQKGQAIPMMIVFDERFYGEAVVWSFTRRFIYKGWPVLPYDTYHQAISASGTDIFKSMGIEEIYYIAPTENIILEPATSQQSLSQLENFEKNLEDNNFLIDQIYFQSKPVFSIYHFDL